MHILQEKHTTANIDYVGDCASCLASVITLFDTGTCSTASGSNCVAKGGCRNDLTCNVTCDSGDLCHQCADRECTLCLDYAAGQCESLKCRSPNATESGGVCSCVPGLTRSTIADDCVDCVAGCTTCDILGGTYSKEFSGCTVCDGGRSEVVYPVASKVFCAPACPTGSINDPCDPAGETAWFEFNVPLISSTSSDSGSITGITWTIL
jgi:hypothetical protein